MPKIDFAVGSFLFGVILALVLLALDKAEKLKGPWPLVLLAFAAALTLPLALSASIVTNAQGATKGFRIFAVVCLVGFIYFVLAAWIATPEPIPAPPPESTPESTPTKLAVHLSPAPLPNLKFVRAEIAHIDLDRGVARKITSARQKGLVALVAVFGSEYADTELMATIEFNDPTNTHIDRAYWLYQKSHVAKLKRGDRKELVIGYKQNNGFVCVENDYERDREIKVKLMRGNELTADVRVLSLKPPVAAQRHRFKITVEPNFGIERID